MPVKEPSFIIKESGLILIPGKLYRVVNARIALTRFYRYISCGSSSFFLFVIKNSVEDFCLGLEFNSVLAENELIEKLFITPDIEMIGGNFSIEEVQ